EIRAHRRPGVPGAVWRPALAGTLSGGYGDRVAGGTFDPSGAGGTARPGTGGAGLDGTGPRNVVGDDAHHHGSDLFPGPDAGGGSHARVRTKSTGPRAGDRNQLDSTQEREPRKRYGPSILKPEMRIS